MIFLHRAKMFLYQVEQQLVDTLRQFDSVNTDGRISMEEFMAMRNTMDALNNSWSKKIIN